MYSLSVFKKNKIYKDLLKIAIPTAIEFFLFNFISLTDNAMVAYLGDYPVAGVSLANKFFELFVTIGFAMVGAYNIIATRQYNRGDFKSFRNTFFISILIIILFSFPFILISRLNPFFLLRLISNDVQAVYYGAIYLNIAIFSFVFAIIKGLVANALKVAEIVKFQVYISVFSVLLNLILNYIFIFGFRMGVVGTAIATTVIRALELIVYLIYTVFNKNSVLNLRLDDLNINIKSFIQLIKFFIPILLNDFIWFFGYLVLTSIFIGIDTHKYAAYSISFSVYFIIFNIINSFCISLNIMMGYEMHNNKKEVMKVAIYLGGIGFKLAFLTSFVLFVFSFFAPYIFYTLKYSQLTGIILRYSSISAFFMALAFQYLFGFFRAGASPSFGAIMEGSVTFIYTIPIAFVLANYTNLPFEIIVFIPALEDAIKLAISLPYFYSERWIKPVKTSWWV
ncbi:MATE family efflux transporter [Borreliella garinii]|uniref:MATE family efflux transporter n=1 Tax=Borreliella garinii TaxID=29519 RepID=UPI00292F02C7|nr:MATE family efflux transporter [Borreliella garinii]WNZ73715.1 MATE family efflux transporter [Borreliella garinii]WNZ74692.1 MATE family efflux transporter [Borreliella garinii]